MPWSTDQEYGLPVTIQDDGLTVTENLELLNLKGSRTVTATGNDVEDDVNGASVGAAITDNAIVRGDGGASGIQDSGVIIDDNDNVTTSGYMSNANFTDSAHYTGFPNQTDTSLGWNDGTYTLTLTASSDYVWINGVKYTIDTLTKQLSVAQEAVSGVYWFWITAPAGVPQLNCDTTPPGFDKCLAATVYWNTTTSKGILVDERHWFGRDQWNHEYLHETVGARYASGMAGTFDNTTLTIGAGEYYDEDIEHENTEQTDAKVLYHNGDADWAWDVLTTPYKVVNPGVDNTLRYNNGNALASVDNNKYTNSWVYMSGDESEPVHIYIDDAQYNTIALARAAEPISRGALTSPEDKIIYRVIYQNVGGTPTYKETTDYRVSQVLGTTYTPTDHGSLSGLGDDDHTQYMLADGTRGGVPGGSDTQVQYNNGGAFAGITNLITDGTNVTLLDAGTLKIGTGGDLEVNTSSDDVILRQKTSDKDIIIYVNDGGSDTALMRIDASVPGVSIGDGAPAIATSGVKFNVYANNASTSATMVIEQDGTGDAKLDFLLSGATRGFIRLDNSDSDKLQFSQNNSDIALSLLAANATFGGTVGITSLTGTGVNAVYATSGNILTTTAPSDRRLKENIETIKGEFLEKIAKLEPVKFNFIGDAQVKVGLIAQEVQKVLPELVYEYKHENGETYLALKRDEVVFYLLLAIKDIYNFLNKK